MFGDVKRARGKKDERLHVKVSGNREKANGSERDTGGGHGKQTPRGLLREQIAGNTLTQQRPRARHCETKSELPLERWPGERGGETAARGGAREEEWD